MFDAAFNRRPHPATTIAVGQKKCVWKENVVSVSRHGRGRPARFDPIEDRQRNKLRLQPPSSLNKEEAAEWSKIVNAAPADWFSDSNTGSLEQYCRHVVAARRIARLIETFTSKPGYNQDHYFKLARQQLAETKMIRGLMTSMRLTHQSSMEAANVKKRMPVAPPLD